MKIAIVGKMRSGKDTVAKFFIDNEDANQIAFGDEIKRIARMYFPHIVAKGKPRKLYQTLGQELRKIDPDVWVKALDRTLINSMEYGETNFVISDVRQMNEYHYLKEMGFTVIKVEADDEIRKERIIKSGDVFEPEDFYHETELAVNTIPYDYLITNNTTLAELYDQIYYIYDELKEGEKV
ncbi:AAA family ATPase [Bacillus cereus group sp. Bc015]|uniref:deoxynucleotide monophosphate kinase family protein n=1 Tax=Bacillus cereus group sp. Bc015 TaxID=3018123 RepID=UPI0022E64C17|nr:AAA family ATPase [Bacillus cereus group sp. Bc015]MDA2738422.1 AAA family ATPase [Bacillus cereus group sp. Bc015]